MKKSNTAVVRIHEDEFVEETVAWRGITSKEWEDVADIRRQRVNYFVGYFCEKTVLALQGHLRNWSFEREATGYFRFEASCHTEEHMESVMQIVVKTMQEARQIALDSEFESSLLFSKSEDDSQY